MILIAPLNYSELVSHQLIYSKLQSPAWKFLPEINDVKITTLQGSEESPDLINWTVSTHRLWLLLILACPTSSAVFIYWFRTKLIDRQFPEIVWLLTDLLLLVLVNIGKQINLSYYFLLVMHMYTFTVMWIPLLLSLDFSPLFADVLVVVVCDVWRDHSACCSLPNEPYGQRTSCLVLEFVLCNVVLFVFDSMWSDA